MDQQQMLEAHAVHSSLNNVPNENREMNKRNNNMVNVNVTQDGQKLVGPIGLKKAEKELIMRRYKYNYQNQNDNLNRVAVIYG